MGCQDDDMTPFFSHRDLAQVTVMYLMDFRIVPKMVTVTIKIVMVVMVIMITITMMAIMYRLW